MKSATPFHSVIIICETFEISKLSIIYLLHHNFLTHNTAKNTVISPDFFVWKFFRKAQFPHSFGRFARNYVENVPFRKILDQEMWLNYGTFCSVNHAIHSTRLKS